MAQATCRLPPVLDEVLNEGVEETGVFRSDLVRRAVVLYMTANPGELEAFAGADVPARFVSGSMGSPARAASADGGATYDPVEDL